MKIKVKTNRCFKLSVEDTQSIIDNYIKPIYPDHEFKVKGSKSTVSVYIFASYENMNMVVRLSDHPRDGLKYHYISSNTKVQKVVSIIANSIAYMHQRALDEILNNL